MEWCNRKRKICFYCKFCFSFKTQLPAFLAGTVAGIITIEACIFFFMLLYFNSENAAYERPPDHSATSHGGLKGEDTNSISSPKPTNMGHLTFLPANRASITVDFKKPAEYSQNYMNLVLHEYAEYKRKACIKAPELSLGDCDWTKYYGLDDGFFCLVVRLEETRNWIPDDFLQTNWLPHYKDDFLPVSCEIVAQNKSFFHHGKLHEFYYRKPLTSIWPASGFPKKLFPLGKAPANCYPPVTIKVDDPFVLNYQHAQISVVCQIWSYNSRTLAADSVSINVTLLHREEALKEARKPKHSPTLLESTSTTKVTLPSTKGTPKGTTNIKPSELLSVRFSKSMPHTSTSTSTNARSTSTFTKSSVPTTAFPLSSTDTKTYMDFTKPSATSHKRSPVTGAAEINRVKPTTGTPLLTEKTSKPTDLILNVTLPSVELQNHSSKVETSSVSILTGSSVNNMNESNSASSHIKTVNFTPTLETSSDSLETTLALEASSILSGNTYHTLDSTSSTLKNTSSTLETTSSTFKSTSGTLKTTPSTLKISPSTLETISSTLETTSSTFETTPSTLKTTPSMLETTSSTLETTSSTLEATLALETSSIPLETSSSTVSTSTEIPFTFPSFDHPPDGGENSHYSDED